MHSPVLSPPNRADLFRLVMLALLIGQMYVYYDTAPKTIPHINFYLLANLLLIVLTLIPWGRISSAVWALAWPLGAWMRWDWATRPTWSDVYWATSQGVDFLLRGMNPYTQVYTWVYEAQPGIKNYPTYSYFPGSLFAEAPFYLLGNVRIGLLLADLGVALLVYLLARSRLGEWPARTLAAAWLLFLPGFQVPLMQGILDFLLLFWIALAVWLYSRDYLVGSALAAAMAFATKQYGFLFALPWGLFLVRPLIISVVDTWRTRQRGWRALVVQPARLWAPPVAGAGFAALLIVPIALLSPKAFIDATIFNHSTKLPFPMLGTPQWNESIAGQLVALNWLTLTEASAVASVVFWVVVLVVIGMSVIKVRDAASALLWSAVLAGVWFAFSSVQVQFFYWRLPLLLFALYYIVSRERTTSQPGEVASVPPDTT
jgi:hypothetical protein